MPKDPERLEVLIRVLSEAEATAIVTALAAVGIKAIANGGHIAGYRAEAPGELKVVVQQKNLAAARSELARLEGEPAEIDWSQVDVGEPLDS